MKELTNDIPIVNGAFQISKELVLELNKCKSIDEIPYVFKRGSLHKNIKFVKRGETGRSTIATANIHKGEVVGDYSSSKVSRPFKYTIQIDDYVHLVGTGGFDHSCTNPLLVIDPSTKNLVAFRDIQRGEVVTYNYLTTEYDLALPFKCVCREKGCFGFIRGFKYLIKGQKEWLRDKFPIARYLLKYI